MPALNAVADAYMLSRPSLSHRDRYLITSGARFVPIPRLFKSSPRPPGVALERMRVGIHAWGLANYPPYNTFFGLVHRRGETSPCADGAGPSPTLDQPFELK
jgi:hypothetical protein